MIHELGLVQQWDAFRDASIANIARRWLERTRYRSSMRWGAVEGSD